MPVNTDFHVNLAQSYQNNPFNGFHHGCWDKNSTLNWSIDPQTSTSFVLITTVSTPLYKGYAHVSCFLCCFVVLEMIIWIRTIHEATGTIITKLFQLRLWHWWTTTFIYQMQLFILALTFLSLGHARGIIYLLFYMDVIRHFCPKYHLI